MVAYHVHQGLERYLKGFLAARGSAIPAVHNLGELLRRAAGLEPDLLRFLEDVQPLTGFFVETLDEDLVLPHAEREDVRHTIQIAWRLRDRLITLLPGAPER